MRMILQMNFGGLPNVMRQEFVSKEKNHTELLNTCIERSYSEGMTVLSPELGISYIAVSGEFDSEKLSTVVNSSSMAFMLNEIKTKSMWMPYYPFTLSIEPKHQYHFIRGDLYLVVVIDLKVLKKFRVTWCACKYC